MLNGVEIFRGLSISLDHNILRKVKRRRWKKMKK